MAGRGRPSRWSAAQRAELWRRWQAGESVSAIGTALAANSGTVFWLLQQQGGIARPPRTRAARVLSSAEREEISRGVATGVSVRALAAQLGRAPSTISRELARHGGRPQYRAAAADAAAWQRARRPKPCRLALEPRLGRVVAAKLRADWSPGQIAGWLVRTYPDDPRMHVSHEAIYRTLYVQARGVLKRELLAHLRRPRPLRRSRRYSRAAQQRSAIPDAVSIAARPATVADRAVPGHWEGDLLAGRGQSYLVTLVERQSRFVQLRRLPRKESAAVVAALTRAARRLPAGLMRSLTWDRGTEMAAHRRFTVATDVAVYFCDPQSPWQRGSNENTNGLLRQYFPKGRDLAGVTQRQLDVIARKLNTRPRETLGFRTPAEVFDEIVASTG
jgi:IS30 family transposase